MRLIMRLVFVLLRSALLFVSITVTGWFLVVSPTASERRLLATGPATNDMRLREAVVQMRLARAALDLAPETAIDLIAGFGRGRVPRHVVEQRLRAIAAGRPPAAPQDTRPVVGAGGGAKFVKPPSRDG